jgi:hypothetical protein
MVWETTVWAGGSGVPLQAVAHGESNPQQVFSGVDGQNGVAASL